MLRLRRAQLEQSVGEEQARLRRVEAHLRAIEGSNVVNQQDVVIKQTQPLRIAEMRGQAEALEWVAEQAKKLEPDDAHGVIR